MSYEQLLGISQDFIAALSSVDVDMMLALRTPDCQQVILPMSNDE